MSECTESQCKIDQIGVKRWYFNGLRHREDGPAIEWHDGSKWWYRNDKLHREDGPAAEHLNGTKEWYQNGQLHRLDGPAVEDCDGTVEYWVNDVHMTEVEYFVRYGVVNE